MLTQHIQNDTMAEEEETEQVTEFPYLGFRVADDGNYETEIRSRLGMTNLGKLETL